MLKSRFPLGARVTVAKAYVGAGQFAPDGAEGDYYVVGHIRPTDLKLAKRPYDPERPEGNPYDLISHIDRVEVGHKIDDDRCVAMFGCSWEALQARANEGAALGWSPLDVAFSILSDAQECLEFDPARAARLMNQAKFFMDAAKPALVPASA